MKRSEKPDWENEPEQYFPFVIDRYFKIEGELIHWSDIQDRVISILKNSSGSYTEYMIVRMLYMCYRIIVWDYKPTEKERNDSMLGGDKTALETAKKIWADLGKKSTFNLGFDVMNGKLTETIEPMGMKGKKRLNAIKYYLLYCIAIGKDMLLADGRYEQKKCIGCKREFIYLRSGRPRKYCDECTKRKRTIQRHLQIAKNGGNEDGNNH